MGFFRSKKSTGTLPRRIRVLTTAVYELQRDMRLLRLEQQEIFDKTHRLFGRIAKRTAIDAAPVLEPDPPTDAAGNGIDEISAKIHARRAAGRPG